MDIPPVPTQPTSFIFPQRSFGMANPVKRSFQASWFSTRTWLRHLNLNGLLVPRQIEIPHQGVGGAPGGKLVPGSHKRYELGHTVILKPIKSAALHGQKLSQSALKSSVRTSGNTKFSRGRSPEPPLREGECPLVCSPPTRAFGTRKMSLILHGRTTFQKPTTAMLIHIYVTSILY